jgi:predicted O-methyltransferase YrrM
VSTTLDSAPVLAVLDRLRAVAQERDEPAKDRVRAREEQIGAKIYGQQRADLYRDASLAVTTEVGELLYVLAVNRRAQRIVEFGCSLGFSTIFLAAALRDIGSGSLLTTESQPQKAAIARENLADAGLSDLVEVREGDARETLSSLSGPVDMLFLDGWNDLYLPILRLVEPDLPTGAMVVADLSRDDPEIVRYQNQVHARDSGYLSITLPLDAGVEVSLRAP